ncbi:phage tail assembly protein [Bradyrhizobium ottawaense]|uniref:Phage tail assembly chaperone protein, E, or 41 or 14 n=1 Tax=Bradyrhizobium ottawaense TaxID=931866 RepID=A0ABY0QH90_9BRAD|nr:phage tail assembly protein [Bradyrhizobium ottawaense]SDK39917.1 Phage tail assembly chaperone protein, E, or 41 or 14 [Bradyrhizobium ottawaense]
MSTEKIFNLKFPFEHRGANYIEFKARRPKVRDLRNFIKNVDKDSVAAMEKVLADLMEIDEKVISEIDVEDFAPMKSWFESFLQKMLGESDES